MAATTAVTYISITITITSNYIHTFVDYSLMSGNRFWTTSKEQDIRSARSWRRQSAVLPCWRVRSRSCDHRLTFSRRLAKWPTPNCTRSPNALPNSPTLTPPCWPPRRRPTSNCRVFTYDRPAFRKVIIIIIIYYKVDRCNSLHWKLERLIKWDIKIH